MGDIIKFMEPANPANASFAQTKPIDRYRT
jgi:hypothetical protein